MAILFTTIIQNQALSSFEISWLVHWMRLSWALRC